jgi:hypothetical protein
MELVAKALRGALSAESRRRLQAIQDAIQSRPPTPKQLQQVRAIQVLEWIGSTDAEAVLAQLCSGASGNRQTEAARFALSRMRNSAMR